MHGPRELFLPRRRIQLLTGNTAENSAVLFRAHRKFEIGIHGRGPAKEHIDRGAALGDESILEAAQVRLREARGLRGLILAKTQATSYLLKQPTDAHRPATRPRFGLGEAERSGHLVKRCGIASALLARWDPLELRLRDVLAHGLCPLESRGGCFGGRSHRHQCGGYDE